MSSFQIDLCLDDMQNGLISFKVYMGNRMLRCFQHGIPQRNSDARRLTKYHRAVWSFKARGRGCSEEVSPPRFLVSTPKKIILYHIQEHPALSYVTTG